MTVRSMLPQLAAFTVVALIWLWSGPDGITATDLAVLRDTATQTLNAYVPWLSEAYVSFKRVLWAAPPPEVEKQGAWLALWGAVILLARQLVSALIHLLGISAPTTEDQPATEPQQASTTQ